MESRNSIAKLEMQKMVRKANKRPKKGNVKGIKTKKKN
jgi:hypothetical protein